MVPVGIFCMAFFGLGAVFDTLTSTARTGSRENPTVASYNGGEFTRDQINEMTRSHYRTRNFLNELRNLGVEQRGDQFVDLVRPISPIQDGQQEYVDEQIIGRKLMAEKAEAEGLVVSDNMVDQYLFNTYGVIDGNGLSNRDLEMLNREVNNGQISMAAIRRHLKTELLNQQMVTLSYSGIPRVPSPLESVELYAKVNQKIECEIFPVSISEYVDDDAMPSQAEIRDLYEKGKFEFKDPAGKRPGFKRSRRVKLQYLIGDYQDFLDKATQGLTDQEIQAKYDELVAQESDLVMEIVIDENEGGSDMPAINLEGEDGPNNYDADDAEGEAAPKPATPAEPGEPAGEPGEGDQGYNVRADESKFVLVSMPAQEETPAAPVADTPVADAVEVVADKVDGIVDTTVDGVADAAKEVVETAKEVVQTEVQTPAEPEPPLEIETELTQETESGVEIDSFEEPQTDSMKTPANADPNAAPNADPKTDRAAPAAASQTKDETADATAEQSADKTADKTDADSAADVGGIGDMKDVDIGPLLTDNDDIVKRAKPLDEVADLIRRQLKGQEAATALNTAIKTAESEIETYYTRRLQWEVNGKERNLPAPDLPDFQALADKHGLRLAGTELVDNEELMETELGGVYKIFTVQNRNIPVPMADVIFDQFNELSEYSSSTTDNRFTGKSYVYWPTELADAEVPKLEDCKDKIIEYWRQQKAVESAMEAAKGIAAKAGKDKKLSDIDPAKTIQTGEFTWFQPRGQRAVLSSPIGVDSPSEDFMKTAFSLGQGEAGVAVDGSGETIFVIQSQTPKASMAEVGDDFLKNQLFRFQRLPPDVGLVSDHYFRQKTLDWNREYVDSMGFELMK